MTFNRIADYLKHIDIPAEMGDEFDIIVLATLKPQAEQELTIENLP